MQVWEYAIEKNLIELIDIIYTNKMYNLILIVHNLRITKLNVFNLEQLCDEWMIHFKWVGLSESKLQNEKKILKDKKMYFV